MKINNKKTAVSGGGEQRRPPHSSNVLDARACVLSLCMCITVIIIAQYASHCRARTTKTGSRNARNTARVYLEIRDTAYVIAVREKRRRPPGSNSFSTKHSPETLVNTSARNEPVLPTAFIEHATKCPTSYTVSQHLADTHP